YELTADLRGMFGWEERAAAVAEVYHALSETERARTLVIARWYGPAGAIDVFGREMGLPPAVSTHMSYHVWGLPEGDWQTVIAVDIGREELERYFGEVTLAKEIELEDVNPWERRFAVHLGRQPEVDLREAWPSLGNYGH
ncbi:MAG: hypothetical protein MI919_35880, partial [Holophagales bacterium]|nr:hypothetical protein [Holophagales bacterium]